MADTVSSSQLPSSSHRLPTVSATQALQKLRTAPSKNVSTGLPRLDELLTKARPMPPSGSKVDNAKGLCCGHIADVYGPPGSGKTALCLQAAVSALAKGHSVVWIDCGTPIPVDRLKELCRISTTIAGEEADLQKLQRIAERFHHYTVADLAHLLALFAYPASDFTDDTTALIVIDSISTPFDTAYSRPGDGRFKKQSELAKWAASRKYAVMGDLITRLQKMATLNNLVVLLTQQTRMRIRTGAGALLLPALSGVEWENGISTQLVLFRDFPPKGNTQPEPVLVEQWTRLRYVGLIKVNGLSAEENGRFETVVPFSIEKEGLRELPTVQTDGAVPILSSPTRTSKRRFEEIADSEDEELVSDDDYGFDEDFDFESGVTEATIAP